MRSNKSHAKKVSQDTGGAYPASPATCGTASSGSSPSTPGVHGSRGWPAVGLGVIVATLRKPYNTLRNLEYASWYMRFHAEFVETVVHMSQLCNVKSRNAI